MKKQVLYMLAALGVTAACTREMAPETVDTRDSNATTIQVVAKMAETRTTMEEGEESFSFKWNEGDRIALIEGCPALSYDACETYKSNPLTAEMEVAVFTVNLEERENLPGRLSYTAMYPPHDNDWEYPLGYYNEYGQLYLGLEFPTEQHPSVNCFDPKADLLLSKAVYKDSRPGNMVQMTFEFARVGTIVKMVFTGLPAGAVIKNGEIDFGREAGYYLEYYPAEMLVKSSDGTDSILFDYTHLPAGGLVVGQDGCAVVWLRCMSGVSREIDIKLNGFTPGVESSWYKHRKISFRALSEQKKLDFMEGGLTTFNVKFSNPDVENPDPETVHFFTNPATNGLTVSWPASDDQDLDRYEVFLMDEDDQRHYFNAPLTLSSDGTRWEAVIGQGLSAGEYTLYLRALAVTGKVSQPDFVETYISIGYHRTMTIGKSSFELDYNADVDREGWHYNNLFGFRNLFPGSFDSFSGTSYDYTWALWNKTPMHLESFSVLPYGSDNRDFQLYVSDEPFVDGIPSGDPLSTYTLDDNSKRRDYQIDGQFYFLLTSDDALQMRNVLIGYYD